MVTSGKSSQIHNIGNNTAAAVREWWPTAFACSLALLCTLGLAWIYLSIHYEADHSDTALDLLTDIQYTTATSRREIHLLRSGDQEIDIREYRRRIDTLGAMVDRILPLAERHRPWPPNGSSPSLRQSAGNLRQSFAALSVSVGRTLDTTGTDVLSSTDASLLRNLHDEVAADCQRVQTELSTLTAAGRSHRILWTRLLIGLWGIFLTVGITSLVKRERKRRRAERALRLSEAHYRELVQILPVGMFEINPDSSFRFANPVFLNMIGCTRDQLFGEMTAVSLLCEEDRDRGSRLIQRLLRDRLDVSEEFQAIRCDGTTLDAIVCASPIITDGEATAIRGIIVDISERKSVERALRQREEDYRTLMRVAPVGIFRTNPAGQWTYLSERGAELLAIPADLSVGDMWLKAIHPTDRDRVASAWRTAVLTEKPFSIETTLVDLREPAPCVLIEAAPKIDTDGILVGYIGSLNDISDRKHAEHALRESEERFRNLSNAATEGLLIHDQGLAIDFNDAFARMLNLSREEIVGQEIFQWIAPEQHAMVREKIRTSDENPYELTIVRPDGTRFLADVSGRLMPWHGHPVRVASVRDQTDRRQAEEEIAKFKTMTDIADYGCAITDLDGVYLYVNRQYAALHGFTESELLGRHMRICHDLDRIGDLDQAVNNFVASQKHGTKEIWHRRKDGSVFPALQTATVIHDPAGKPLYMAGTVIDISDLKETERMLQQMAAVPENDPNLILTMAVDGRILYRNPAAVRVSFPDGSTEDQIAAYLPPAIQEIIGAAISTGTGVIDIEQEVDGRTWTWSVHPVAGQPVAHCFGRDRTVRKRRESELRQLSAAVQQSASMVCITDTNGIITYVNERFSEATGYTPEEAVGRSANLLKSGRQDRACYADLWQTISQGGVWTGRMLNRRNNGELYWERKVISPIFSAEGAIINYLSVGEDITIELSTQQKLAESDKMSAVGMLAAGVAHEFKNYLGGIIGNASFALEELDNEGALELARSTLQQIIETGDRANDVAMSLLSYSKARPDDFSAEDLRQVVTRSLNLIEKEMRTVSIEIVTHFDDIPKIEISASKIQQLLLNLLINAQHAIGSDGVISIVITKTPAHVLIRVADTGVGIPEENLGRIFDPFYSTKGVWGKDELVGTGMGLAICRNIAREHAGDLTVESIVGMGTSFTLSLPLDRTGPCPTAPVADSLSQKRVLIFTLDKEIFKKYVAAAVESSVRVLWVDSITSIGKDLGRLVDLVVCDAKFTGKVELLRMIEKCRQENVPHVMINCGVMEYQLADLYESSRANFKQAPDLPRLLACAGGSTALAEQDNAQPETD